MAREDYQKALKKGERSYARYLSEGKYPYLQVLEELLSHTDVVAEEDLGICSISDAGAGDARKRGAGCAGQDVPPAACS